MVASSSNRSRRRLLAMYLKTPYVLAVNDSPAKNLLRQVAVPSAKLDGTLTPFTAAKIQGLVISTSGQHRDDSHSSTQDEARQSTKQSRPGDRGHRHEPDGGPCRCDRGYVAPPSPARQPPSPGKRRKSTRRCLIRGMAPFRTSSKTPTLASSACGGHNSERCMQFTLIGMSRRLQRLWSCRPERAKRRRCSRFSSQHSATGYS